MWDAESGQPIGPALEHGGPVLGAVFSSDESRILTWSDETAHVWDAACGQPIGPALEHGGPVFGAVFSTDESRILTWSEDKTARLWHVGSDFDLPEKILSLKVRALTGIALESRYGDVE